MQNTLYPFDLNAFPDHPTPEPDASSSSRKRPDSNSCASQASLGVIAEIESFTGDLSFADPGLLKYRTHDLSHSYPSRARALGERLTMIGTLLVTRRGSLIPNLNKSLSHHYRRSNRRRTEPRPTIVNLLRVVSPMGLGSSKTHHLSGKKTWGT